MTPKGMKGTMREAVRIRYVFSGKGRRVSLVYRVNGQGNKNLLGELKPKVLSETEHQLSFNIREFICLELGISTYLGVGNFLLSSSASIYW